MDTGNKYQVNDYNKTNNISTVDIMNDNNNNNNILENNNNDNNIFKQLEEEENEARKIEHELDTVSKSEILKAMPASFRFAAKLVFLFENDKHPIKFILKWISIIASIYFGIIGLLNIQENGQLKIGIAQLPAPICFCIYGPMSIMKVHHFFNGNVGRSAFLKSWKKLPKSSKQLATKYFSNSLIGWLTFTVFNLVGFISFISDSKRLSNIPEWVRIVSTIGFAVSMYSFTIGFILYFTFLIFILVVESEVIAFKIKQMSEKINKVIYKFFESGCDDDHKIMNRNTTINRKEAKKIIKIFIQSLETIAVNVKRPVRILGNSVGLVIFSLILYIILMGIHFVFQSFQSDYILDIGGLVGFVITETLWMYGLYILLTISMKPSIAYTRFLESIHRGDYVLILAECFNSDNNGALKYFLDGLEIQRRSVIWMIFGIPVTLEMYERVIGSLVSLLIAAIALILRSSA